MEGLDGDQRRPWEARGKEPVGFCLYINALCGCVFTPWYIARKICFSTVVHEVIKSGNNDLVLVTEEYVILYLLFQKDV